MKLRSLFAAAVALVVLVACGGGPLASLDASISMDAGELAPADGGALGLIDVGGVGPDASETPEDAAASAPDAALTPAIIFTVDEGGQARPVTSVVYSEPYDVRLQGFEPGEIIELQGRLWGYRSHAEFLVDSSGTVDLARDAPLSGTYQGIDADGLVWSMVKESDQTGNTFDVTYAALRRGVEVATARIERKPMGSDATFVSLSAHGLRGTLMVPAGGGRHPALLVLGGSEGGTPLFEAAYFEKMGYATLALAYFGTSGLPSQLTDIPLEYFDRAIDWLRARSEIDPERIGVAGGSRGGELALILSARNPHLKATVALVPSGLVMGSASQANLAAWTSGEVAIPYFGFASGAWPVRETLPNGETGYRFSPVTEADLDAAPPQEIDAARIPVEMAKGPILLLAGEDDGLWPSCRLSKYAWDTLLASQHADSFADGYECFPQAGHLFAFPGWPTTESYATQAGDGTWLVAGGTASGNGRAGRLSDTRIRAFLATALGK